jgi:flagellin-like hook-associated protein FlgL
LKRLGAVETNLLNADSFVRVQDDALKSVGDLVTRMSELKILSQDVSKSPADIANYATEYWELASGIREIGQRKFNGIPLFSDTDKEQFLYCQSRQEGGQIIELVLPPLKESTMMDIVREHLYEIINGARYYDDAASDAQTRGGYLATITSATEWEDIVLQLGATALAKDPLWIGLHQSIFGSEPAGGWQWNTGEAYGFEKWHNGQPTASDQPDNGGQVGPYGPANYLAWNQPAHKCGAAGHLGDEAATDTIGGYILQYTDASGTAVYQAVNSPSPMTWDQAKDAAYQFDLSKLPVGASRPRLATLKSDAEYSACYNQMAAQGINANHMLWLGGFQSMPSGWIETKKTAGENWFWIPELDPGTTPITGQTNGVAALPSDFIAKNSPHGEPDDVSSTVINENAAYLSGPFGDWYDSVEDPSAEGVKGYLLEKDVDFTKIPLSGITRALEWVAHYRARCGAESMAIGIAATAARTAHVNLEQARSRIADVDVARATIALTRAKILSETGAKMLVKAHDAMQIAVKLLDSLPAA